MCNPANENHFQQIDTCYIYSFLFTHIKHFFFLDKRNTYLCIYVECDNEALHKIS